MAHPDLDAKEAKDALNTGGWEDNPEKGKQLAHELWRLAAIAAAFITGGRARKDGFGRADQDAKQHALGLEVELEHVNPAAREDIQMLIRGRISRDHEAEKVPGGYYFRNDDGEAEVAGEE